MRTVLLGLLGLALAVVVGFGVHLITRGTISLPVVQLQQPPPVRPRATTPRTSATTARGTSTAELEPQPKPQPQPQPETVTEPETDDSSGRGQGRSGDDSGGNSGRGDEDD